MTTDSNTVTRRMTLDMTYEEISQMLAAIDTRLDYLTDSQSRDRDPDWWAPKIATVGAVKAMVLTAYGRSVPSEFSGWDSLPAYYQRKGVEGA